MGDLLFFCLADDLTGALEIGSRFAGEGLAALVSTRSFPGCDVPDAVQALVVDTETRHVLPGEACLKVFQAASAAPSSALIYKKTDSTLRGNIASEMRGLAAAFPGMPIIYVPAYPEMGRTVRSGRLYVGGIAVEHTGFAADPLNPARESHIPTLLAAEVATVAVAPEGIRNASGSAVHVVDAETDDEVGRAAEAFCSSGLRLAAGPAEFAAHLARRSGGARTRPRLLPTIRTCLVVNGSLNERSALQIDVARGWLPVCPPGHAAQALARSPWVLLNTAALGSSGLERARDVGKIVREVLDRAEVDAMVVFGGDTAFGILQALGEPALHPVGDVVPGVPLSFISRTDLRRGATRSDLFLISKAGGFGSRDVLGLIRARMARE